MKSDFKQGRPGLAFKDGKLYEFTKRHVLVVTGGDDPRAWFKRRSHGWKATRKWADALFVSRLSPYHEANGTMNVPEMAPVPAPDGPVVIDHEEVTRRAREQWVASIARREEDIMDGYRATIPPVIRAELYRYRERLWQLYNALARCPGAIDLSRGNPALLFGLANNWVFHKPPVTHPLRSARRMVNRKQKVILEWLGFPGTEQVRRLTAKITPDALGIRSLLLVRRCVIDPAWMKKVTHLGTINSGVLRLMSVRKYQPFLTPRLLSDVSRMDQTDPEADLVDLVFKDTLRMAEAEGWRHCPLQFHSLHRLREVHDDLTRRMNRQFERVIFMAGNDEHIKPFPRPPFNGNAAIHPILNPKALCDEGREMRHCVLTHGASVFSGYEYVYKVVEPVRATLMVRREPNGWVPGEIAMQGNRLVDKQVARSLFEALFNSGYYSGDRSSSDPASKEPDINEILPKLSSSDRADVEMVLKIFGGRIAEVRVPIP